METSAVNDRDSPGSKPISFLEKKIYVNNTVKNFKQTNFYTRNHSYSLNLQNFNPDKMSPPDSWKFRIEKRLVNYF
tara:strand:- start:412 stop:639 length:228 start_codon:yes stop_codon:yes gene_type:complete